MLRKTANAFNPRTTDAEQRKRIFAPERMLHERRDKVHADFASGICEMSGFLPLDRLTSQRILSEPSYRAFPMSSGESCARF